MPQMSPFNWTFMFMLFLLMSITLMSKLFINKKMSSLFKHMSHNTNSKSPILYKWTW